MSFSRCVDQPAVPVLVEFVPLLVVPEPLRVALAPESLTEGTSNARLIMRAVSPAYLSATREKAERSLRVCDAGRGAAFCACSQSSLSWTGDNQRVTGPEENVRVLVVDDEPGIVDVISMALRHHGFGVESAGSGKEALDQVRRWRPHVMVLDVMLPDMEGFEVARRLSAEHAEVPILFLSARDTTADKVRGLTTGGDDYVTKPFSLEELIARLRNILRRTGAYAESSSRLSFADLELDEDTFEVSRAGRLIELTATEFRLLRYLMLNPRRVLTRAQLLDHVWSYDFGGDARVLETYISYLRKKIDADGPPLLHTVRGVGYALRLPRG